MFFLEFKGASLIELSSFEEWQGLLSSVVHTLHELLRLSVSKNEIFFICWK